MPPSFEIAPVEFAAFCEKNNLPAAPAELDLLRTYLELLLKWNNKINLTAGCDWRQTMCGLIADSFHLNNFIHTLSLPSSETNETITWDLGAGGGLPGIPLRILWGSGSYHMVELREKRALFLKTVTALLKLPLTFAHRANAAEFMQSELKKNAPANLILSRAFMPWQKLLPYVEPYLAPGGIVLLLLNGSEFKNDVPGWKHLNFHIYDSPSGSRQFIALTPF